MSLQDLQFNMFHVKIKQSNRPMWPQIYLYIIYIYSSPSLIYKNQKIRQQEAPNSGGRKSLCQIQATVAMEQYRNCRTYTNLYRGAHKIFIQELPMTLVLSRISTGSQQNILKDLHQIMQAHREDFIRTSSRDSHKDLYKIMQGPLTAFH